MNVGTRQPEAAIPVPDGLTESDCVPSPVLAAWKDTLVDSNDISGGPEVR